MTGAARAGALAAAALGLALALARPAPIAAAAGAWHDDGPAQLRLLSAWTVAAVGSELRLGLEVRLDEGWHIYWENSGDAGYPPKIRFEPGSGLAAAEILFPVPHRFEMPGGLLAFGYERELVYPLRTAGVPSSGAALELAATVDYVVCADECIPFTSRLALTQPLGAVAVPDPEAGRLLARFERLLPRRAEGLATAAWRPSDELSGRMEWAFRGAAEAVDLFFAVHPQLDFGPPERTVVGGEVRFSVPYRRRDLTQPLPEATTVAWTLALAEGGLAGRTELRRGAASAARVAVLPPAWLAWAAAVAAGLVWALWPRPKPPALA